MHLLEAKTIRWYTTPPFGSPGGGVFHTARYELQQERKQRETQGTLQHEDRHVKHKGPESKWEAREFEKGDEEECVYVLGVSEV